MAERILPFRKKKVRKPEVRHPPEADWECIWCKQVVPGAKTHHCKGER